MNKSLKFLTLTVNINLVFQVDNKLCPQIYLDECFYENFVQKKIENESENENKNENENDNENDNENENK